MIVITIIAILIIISQIIFAFLSWRLRIAGRERLRILDLIGEEVNRRTNSCADLDDLLDIDRIMEPYQWFHALSLEDMIHDYRKTRWDVEDFKAAWVRRRGSIAASVRMDAS